MVDLLVREERTAEHLTHHQDMLEDVSVLACVGMPLGRLDVDVSLPVAPGELEPGADWLQWLSPLALGLVASA